MTCAELFHLLSDEYRRRNVLPGKRFTSLSSKRYFALFNPERTKNVFVFYRDEERCLEIRTDLVLANELGPFWRPVTPRASVVLVDTGTTQLTVAETVDALLRTL